VLFPVGNRNRHQHPHARVRARYELVGARQYDSPAAGALEARLGVRGVEIDAYRERARRYWFAD
jgi:beta-lactamase superfamily II metal-dependent hydrolase